MRSKERIREEIWRLLEDKGVARFPGARGRIPNFVGAERAARKVLNLDVWARARRIKINPDSPQRPLRELALLQGKFLYMAVPRLWELRCFIELVPSKLKSLERAASTIKGAFRYGTQVHPSEMPKIDLVVAGSVAVRRDGARIGKGGGYSDLEFAIGRHFGLIDENTPVITTVHPLQIIDREFEMREHDIPVDFIVTPEGVIATDTAFPKPSGIYWGLLDEEKIKTIPILRELRGIS
ncbi:MAG: 5-formyltetrahydrofolate cyclo-ligase [Candidatus Hydrothermae bacterium]|nr:5-formyltetrahydrofolate cyclo-ligase [Candidatus Hydrothermae bacterium]